MATYAVVADREAAYAFVCRFYQIGRTEQMKGLCQVRNGDVIAAVIFDDFNGSNVFMHVAAEPGKRWLTRHFLHEAFKHPFVTLKARRITLWVDEMNVVCRKFVLHLGFTPEAVLEQAAAGGGDVIIYRMLRGECRYA